MHNSNWTCFGGCSVKATNGQYPSAVQVSAGTRGTSTNFIGGVIAVMTALCGLSQLFWIWAQKSAKANLITCYISEISNNFLRFIWLVKLLRALNQPDGTRRGHKIATRVGVKKRRPKFGPMIQTFDSSVCVYSAT